MIRIMEKYVFGSEACSDSRWYVSCTILDYVQEKFDNIEGVSKIVKVESKFGKWKYGRGHAADGQWVFGGAERDLGHVSCGCK